MEYWLIAFLCQILLANTKTFFWEYESNFGYLQNLCSYLGVPYKLVLNSVKDQNEIFSVIEFKAL